MDNHNHINIIKIYEIFEKQQLSILVNNFWTYLNIPLNESIYDGTKIFYTLQTAQLEHPFIAHQIVRDTHILIHKALEKDPSQVQKIFNLLPKKINIINSASENLERTESLFEEAYPRTRNKEAPLDLEVHKNLILYKDYAEMNRYHTWLLFNLMKVINSETSEYKDPPPLLSELNSSLISEEKLLDFKCETVNIIDKNVDADLRNAIAHNQYFIDDQNSRVKDILKDKDWLIYMVNSSVPKLRAIGIGSQIALILYYVSNS